MSKIGYRGTLVCSINVSDLDRSVRPGEDGVRLANLFEPDGNPLTLAEPNQPTQAGQ